MGRYNFISTGAAMSEGLDEFLAREDAKKRQAMLDEITRSQEARMVKRDKDVDEDRDAAAEDRRNREDDLLAGRWAQDHEAGEIDPLMAELARRRGFGGGLKDSNIASGEQQLDGETDETVRMRPAITSGGGTKQVMARTAAEAKAEQARILAQEKAAAKKADEEFKAEQAKLKREADAEQKQRDRELRGTIASSSNAIRTDAAKDKKEAAEKEAVGKRKVIQNMAVETLSTIDQLLDDEGNLQPGVSGIVGRARVPAIVAGIPGIREIASAASGGDVADKQAAFDTLKSKLMVDLIAEMKAQTKTGATGFGSLSEAEGRILMNAAAQLQQAQTEPQMQTILRDLRTKLTLMAKDPEDKNLGMNVTVDPATKAQFDSLVKTYGGASDAPANAASAIAARRAKRTP